MESVKQEIKHIGKLQAVLTSDVYDGELLDTKVWVEEGVLCWVAGSDREEFIKELNEIIEKYRI